MLAFYYIMFDFRAFRSIRIYVRNVQGGIPLTHLETIALGPSVFVKGVTFVRMENAAWGKHSLWFHCFVCKEMPRFNHLTSKKHYNAIQNFARGRCLLVKCFGTTLEVCKNCENSKSRQPNMMFEFTGETNFEIHSFWKQFKLLHFSAPPSSCRECHQTAKLRVSSVPCIVCSLFSIARFLVSSKRTLWNLDTPRITMKSNQFLCQSPNQQKPSKLVLRLPKP